MLLSVTLWKNYFIIAEERGRVENRHTGSDSHAESTNEGYCVSEIKVDLLHEEVNKLTNARDGLMQLVEKLENQLDDKTKKLSSLESDWEEKLRSALENAEMERLQAVMDTQNEKDDEIAILKENCKNDAEIVSRCSDEEAELVQLNDVLKEAERNLDVGKLKLQVCNEEKNEAMLELSGILLACQ